MGRTQGIGLHNAGPGAGLSSLPHPTHRPALKTPNQVRWPVSLNQLAALSLDDDSDQDRSFTEGTRDDIGSVRLLRMLKDSDDDDLMSPLPAQSTLQRPRSTYSTLPQQRPQQQQLKGGIPVARSSSLHGVSGSHSTYNNTNIPRPQRVGSDNRGFNALASPTSVVRPGGLRSRPGMSLAAGKRQPQRMESPDDMEHIFSEANAVAQRLGGSPSTANGSHNAGRDKVQGIRTPNIKSGSLPSPVARTAAGKLLSSSSSANGSPSTSRLQPKSRLSAPSKLLGSSPASNLGQRPSVPGSRQAAIPREQRESDRVTPSPPGVSGSPSSVQSTTAARKLAGLQYSPLSRPTMSRHAAIDTRIATAMLPTQPVSMSPPFTPSESESSRTIRELTEELERWKTEASEFRQERLAAESWRKQVSTLERDLEVALDALQSAEGQVIEAKAEQQTAGSKLAEFEMTIESLKTDLDVEKAEKDKVLAIASEGQKEALHEIQSRNEELEQKLTQAQKEIDQLELQAVPVELQDVHQSLFSATQELEDAKRLNEELKADLAEEKAKVVREQEDSGQLLLKLSQLQVIISNHIQDNNTLKEVVKEHEKCQENAEALDYQHKKELERLQNEIMGLHQAVVQEKDQRSRFEQALQEHQYQMHQQQQQVQFQQTQLLQQQTEIVNTRAALEVEQKQAALLQQRLQEEQRFNNLQFGRRVSMDGDMNSSFMMVESPTGANMGPGPVSMSMTNAETTMNMLPTTPTMMMGGGMAGVQTLSTSGPNAMSPMTHSLMSSGLQSIRNFDNPSTLSNQLHMSAVQAAATAAALPPTASGIPVMSSGGMISSAAVDSDTKPRMMHRGSSSSISSVVATGNASANRLSLQSDSLPSSGGVTQTVEELTAQLQSSLKEKERLQADLSKIPISGGGPMTRRKAEMLEEQMDETERAISKIRYSIRMRS